MLDTSVESVAGRRVRVARLGAGPPVVLLHGYPDTLQLWSQLAPRLARSFQVIAFDWPGMGCSEAWPGGATPYHMADHLRTLLDTWKVEQASLVGIDMGGQPALALSARYPERVRRLVVMNSLVQWDAPTSWEISVLRRFGWNRLALRHFPRFVFHRALRTFLPSGETLAPAVRDDMWRCFRRRNVRDFIVRMCAGYEGTLPRLAADYQSIQTPTLALWAGSDKHFPLEHARRLCRALPNAQLSVVNGAHHWMPLSVPEDVARSILQFAT